MTETEQPADKCGCSKFMSTQTDKITTEAWQNWMQIPHSKRNYLEFATIIKSAIESVDEQWRERFRKFEKIEDKFGPASQRTSHSLPASEQGANKIAAKARATFILLWGGHTVDAPVAASVEQIIKSAIEEGERHGFNEAILTGQGADKIGK